MLSPVRHLAEAELEAGLDDLRRSPAGEGTLELIVRRPAVDAREIVEEGVLDLEQGLLGDNWLVKGSPRTPDGLAAPDKQVTVMNVRAVALIAGDRERWALAGDQLYVDLDLSIEALPAGSQLHIGEAVLVVSESPHTGCVKFSARFGKAALRFVNSPEGLALRLRGLNTRVLVPGVIRVGDRVRVAGLTPAAAAPAGRTGG
jgi:hypothetical protein